MSCHVRYIQALFVFRCVGVCVGFDVYLLISNRKRSALAIRSSSCLCSSNSSMSPFSGTNFRSFTHAHAHTHCFSFYVATLEFRLFIKARFLFSVLPVSCGSSPFWDTLTVWAQRNKNCSLWTDPVIFQKTNCSNQLINHQLINQSINQSRLLHDYSVI